jgi:Capsule assembly protein Wzi/PAP2 superfamily
VRYGSHRLLELILLVAMASCAFGQQSSNTTESLTAGREVKERSDVVAEDIDPDNRIGFPLIRHLAEDQKHFWVDGATRWDRNKAKQFLPFVGFTSALIASDSWMSKQVPASWTSHSHTVATYGTYSLVGAAGTSFLLGKLLHNEHLQETGLLSGEAAINSTAIAYALKGITGRERPYQGTGNGSFFQGGSSFPSEHSAVAWSIASVAAHEYPGTMTKVLAYGLASAVTLSKVTAKDHFPTDVVVGSALGWYMGRQVYRARHDPELGGGPWGDIEFASEAPGPRIERMSSPPVPLDSWVYPALERLAALGYVSSAYAGQRPWTRLQCALMLQEAADALPLDDMPSTSPGGGTYSSLVSEFQPELNRLEGSPNVGLSLDQVYTRITGISGPPLRDSYHFGQSIVNDYGRPYAEGVNNYDGFIAHAEAGPLSFILQGEFQHAPGTRSYPLSTLQAMAAADSTGIQSNLTGPVNRFQLLTSAVALTWRNTQFSFGNQSLWMGQGDSGALLMANNAEPFPMFRMQSVSPFRIPVLSAILGPIQTEFFLGQLSGHHWEVNSPNVVGPNISPQPFIHGEKISFKPIKNLEIGMGITAMFAGPGLPFTWSNFLRTYYIHSPDPATNPGKRTSELDVSYRIPNFMTVYLDSMVVDEVSPIGSTRPTLNPGVYFPRLPKLPRLELRAEGIKEPLTSQFAPGFVYYDARRYLNGYTNDGLLMGSWIGRAGYGGQGWLTYSFSPQTKLQLGYRHQEVSKDFIGGGRLVDYSASGEARISRNFGVSGSVQYEQWRFPEIAPDRKSNVAVSVTFKYFPHLQNGH